MLDFGESPPPYHQHEEQEVEQGGNGPGDRVGQIQAGGSAVEGEDGGNPDQPQAAGPNDGGDHGNYRAAQSPQYPHQGIHNAADEVGTADKEHPHQRLFYHVGLAGGVNAGQGRSQEVGQIAAGKTEQDGKENAQPGNPVHPVTFGSAVILAYKGDGRLMEGVHGDVDKALDIGPGGGAGHQYGVVKGVEGGLDDHIGKGKYHPLESRGQTDLDDLDDHLFL